MRLALLLICSCMASLLSAQDCSIPFTEPLFSVQAETDLWYGNATRFNGTTDSLRLNLFKPIGDGQTERPLVIAIHGGGFAQGHRNDLNALCQTLAGMGWASATISYRLGFYGNGLFDPPWAYDPAEVRRAIYRAMQDTKGAVRFLKGRADVDSTSTTNVLLLGFSAGAITALSAAYLDQPFEKPASCGSIGPVQHFLNFYPRPDLGDVEGDLHTGAADASVLGVVNFYGAMLDTAHIESADAPALFSYHQIGDPVVGCGFQRPYHGIGLGIPDNYPYLYGSCAIDPHMQALGPEPGRYQFQLHPGSAHEVHDPTGVLLESAQWMRDLFCGLVTSAPHAEHAPAIHAYPNPTTGLLHMETSTGPLGFNLYDGIGRLAYAGVIHPGMGPIDLGHLPDGLYLLRSENQGRPLEQRILLVR